MILTKEHHVTQAYALAHYRPEGPGYTAWNVVTHHLIVMAYKAKRLEN